MDSRRSLSSFVSRSARSAKFRMASRKTALCDFFKRDAVSRRTSTVCSSTVNVSFTIHAILPYWEKRIAQRFCNQPTLQRSIDPESDLKGHIQFLTFRRRERTDISGKRCLRQAHKLIAVDATFRL